MEEDSRKTAREIFRDIPLPLKIVVVVGSIFIIFVICYVTYLLTTYEAPKKSPRLLGISNSHLAAGILDPSVTTDGTRKVMAYTAIMNMQDGSFATEIRTSLGSKNCLSWSTLSGKMEQRPDKLIGPDLLTPVADGSWRAETPSIVYDPADTGREWKLFAYRYFWSGSAPLARLYGVIVMRTTSNPLGQNWSNEEWILSTSDSIPPKPYGDLVSTKLNTLHTDLRDIYFYARPSVVNVDDVLVMSLSAFVQGKDSPERIIMLASTDHARSWRYLGTALRESDIQKMGAYTRLSGGGLFMKDKTMYLSVMLGTKDSDAVGAHILEFEDASSARLRRDPKTGAISVIKHIGTLRKPSTRLGGGALAYTDECAGKTFISESFNGLRHDVFMHPLSPVD